MKKKTFFKHISTTILINEVIDKLYDLVNIKYDEKYNYL